jgi:hypothetical protein
MIQSLLIGGKFIGRKFISGKRAAGHAIARSLFTCMKPLGILASLVFSFSFAAFGQTPICQLPATGQQPYSLAFNGGIPDHVPEAFNELLGFIPQPYVPLPGMPASPLAFCGPAWQPNYTYAVGNLIELTDGTVLQAVSCTGLCKSGATEPAGFSGKLFEPSPVGIWVSTCSDSSGTATCNTVDAAGTPAPVNFGEPLPGADVGSTFVILSYTPDAAYSGSWVVTASTGTSPFTVSFAASNIGSADCTTIGSLACVGYQQGSQVQDNGIVWQDVGPQNETVAVPSFTVSGTAVSVSPGATTGNTSTTTVTSVGGFTGSVTLTAVVTSSPAGAQDLPTLSFGSTSTVDVTPDAAGTATLTISTTAANGAALAYPGSRGARWYTASGIGVMTFALIVGIGIGPRIGVPAGRRSWRVRLGPLVLLVILAGGLLACGSGYSGGGGGGNSGTTPGSYTVTITGTSGGTTATGTVTLTVQ